MTDQLPVPQQQPGPLPDQTADQGQPAIPADVPGEEEEEVRHSGHVKGRVYTAYAMAAGPFLVSVILVSLTLMQVTTTLLMYCLERIQHVTLLSLKVAWESSHLFAAWRVMRSEFMS